MTWGIFKSDSISETYKKMKAEELKGKQHKLDVDKDGKIEGEDLAKLRAQKEEIEQVEESSNPRATNDRVIKTDTGTIHRAKPGVYGGYKKDREDNKLKTPKQLDRIDQALHGKMSEETEEQVDEAMQKSDVPAYLRKQQGEKPLTVADVKGPRKDSISSKEGLAKLRNEEVDQIDEKIIIDKDGNKIGGGSVGDLIKDKDWKKFKPSTVPTSKLAKEEVEQIDELSIGALKNYIKGAKASKHLEADAVRVAQYKDNHAWASDATQVMNKRKEGIKVAKAKLNKEGLDLFSNREIDTLINEVLKASDDAGKWISDFIKSDDPRFTGDSKEQRKKRALAAYYAAQKKESVDYDSFLEDYSIEDYSIEELKQFIMSEHFEQLDELSKKTLSSYVNKAVKSLHRNAEPEMKAGLDGNSRKALRHGLKVSNRSVGLDKAINKLTREEVEQIDELSKKTLGSYALKAKNDIHDKGHSAAEKEDDWDYQSAEADRAIATKRVAGIKKAVKRLTKESLEEAVQGEIVKSGSKEIKHANVKDKKDDQEIMEPHSQGEQDFLDQHSVLVTDDPAGEYKSGGEKLALATRPVGKGAGKYEGKNKTGIKESSSEEDGEEESDDCTCKEGSSKKTYSTFKEKMNNKKGC